ncbi:MAG: hypothetical protein QXT31_03425 [Candidatus Bathyarchaeia archaeon]
MERELKIGRPTIIYKCNILRFLGILDLTYYGNRKFYSLKEKKEEEISDWSKLK